MSFAPPAKTRASGVIPVVGLLGSILAGILYWAHSESGKVAAQAEPVPAESSAPSTSAAPSSPSTAAAAVAHGGAAPSEDDLPPGAEVPSGFGLLEVEAPPRTAVRVDGVIAGSGPFVASVARPGYHEVRVGDSGHDTKHVVEVRAGKRTHVRAALLP
jgi:hypothetical protein